MTLLLSSTICDLHVGFDEKTVETSSISPIAAALFRDIVNTTAPHLTALSLFETFPLASPDVALLSRCHNLCHLFLTGGDQTVLDAGAIRVLEHLGLLESLSLAIRLDGCNTAADLGLEIGFPELDHLCVSGSSLDVSNFVIAANLAALDMLEVTLVGLTNRLDVEECANNLGAYLPRGLPKVHLRVSTMSPHSPRAVLADILEPFFALSRLKSFECDLGAHIPHMSDDDFVNMAGFWPKLEWLGIGPVWGPREHDLRTVDWPTIDTLVGLAQHCPRLRTLNLPSLETTSLPSPEELPVLGRSRTQWLKLGWLSACGPHMYFDLAVLLDRLFPRLEKFEVRNLDQVEGGRQVFQYLQAMQTGRKHSRVFRQEPEMEVLTPVDSSEEEVDE